MKANGEIVVFASIFVWLLIIDGYSGSNVGLLFTNEPPRLVEFSNNTGAKIECSATGEPPPRLTWSLADGASVKNVASVIQIHADGTLVFPPFSATDYKQDIHAAVYRCKATNSVGTIVSREVQVKAVLLQSYIVHIYDVYAILGNTAVMKCHVPTFLLDYVHVTSWIRDAAFVIQTTADKEGKYVILPNGELHIREVGPKDAMTNFRCQTHHRLTGETRLSSSAGRLFLTEPQGNVPPRISATHAAVHVREGEIAILSCVAQGYPVPNTTWFLRGVNKGLQPLRGGERVSQKVDALVIRGARVADSATYVCVASNLVGAEQAETVLTVTAPLSVKVEPAVLVAEIKKPAVFTCLVSGYPIKSVTWMKDGRPIVTPKQRSNNNEKLRIDSVSPDDRGMYQCHVQNDFESQQATAEIRLGDIAPEFVIVFDEKFQQPGTSVSLRCATRGVPLPEITWLLDDFALPRAERFHVDTYINRKGDLVSILNITRARVEDGGVYKCVAQSKAGIVEHASRINIYGRPAVRPMDKKTVVAGEDVSFNCAMYGYPIESVNWEKDGAAIPLDLRRTIFPNGTLFIRSVQRSFDSGRYRCIVRNKQGHGGHGEVEVAVMVPPTIVPFSFQAEHLFDGSLARVSCVVSQGDLPLSLSWEWDGVPVSPGVRGLAVGTYDAYTSVLSIDPVSPAHNGNYTCVANNSAATMRYTAQLVVNVPPRWTLEPRETTVLVGRSAVIHCQVEGFPTPTITWRRSQDLSGETKKVENGDEYNVFVNGSLIIKQAAESHRGYYFCQASNGIGNDLSRGIYLRVHVPVRIETKMQSFTVKEGEHVRARCEAKGDHPINFTWRTDGQTIESGTHSRYYFKDFVTSSGAVAELTVTNAQKTDTRIFVCAARNPFGGDLANVQVIVQGVPEAPKIIQIMEIENRSVELSWNPPYDGNSRITKYILQYKPAEEDWVDDTSNLSVSGGHSTVIVRGLMPSTAYHFQMFAENGVGLSPPSELISITMEEEVPGAPPQDLNVEATDPQTLRVTWKPPPREHWNGPIRGYYVGYRVFGNDNPFNVQTVPVPDDYMEELTFMIPNLQKYTQYGIMIQAFNDKGQGPKTDEVVIMTSEDVPSKPPGEVQCSVDSSTVILVSWIPPPPDSVNGILRGYRILYKPVDEWLEIGKQESIRVTDTEEKLKKLEKNANYSIQVMGFTNMGDGVKSEPVYCKTKEDIPAPPAEIKVLPLSTETVLVVWKPPIRPNGQITKYNVYARELEDDNKNKSEVSTNRDTMQRTSHHNYPTKHSIRGDAVQYEVKGLKKNHRYEFWVTASTSVGEGQSTEIVSESLIGPVAPKSASFSETLTTAWKKEIRLQCRGIGHPMPQREWTFKGVAVQPSNRIVIDSEGGTLSIKNVQIGDAGNYTCRLYNKHGEDFVHYLVVILIPPSAPTVRILSSTLTSIELQWHAESSDRSPVQAYLLHYQPDNDQWKMKEVDAEFETFRLESLLCGTKYHIYVEAVNKIGVGEPSETITIHTEGSVPTSPAKERLVVESRTSVTLNLGSWIINGCPILSFLVEYKPFESSDWVVARTSLSVDQRKCLIEDLQPETWYKLRVTAFTTAGSTVEFYTVGTLTLSGATMSPEVLHADRKGVLFYLDLRIIIPFVIVLALLLFVSVFAMCFFINKRKTDHSRIKGKPPLDSSSAELTLRKLPAKEFNSIIQNSDPLSRRYSSTPTRVALGSQEDLTPYAADQLPNFHYGELKTFGQRKTGQNGHGVSNNDDSYWQEKKSLSEQSLKEKLKPDSGVVGVSPSSGNTTMYNTWDSTSSQRRTPGGLDSPNNLTDSMSSLKVKTGVKITPIRPRGCTEETTFIFPIPPNVNGSAPSMQGTLRGDIYDRLAASRNGISSTEPKHVSPDEATRLLK